MKNSFLPHFPPSLSKLAIGFSRSKSSHRKIQRNTIGLDPPEVPVSKCTGRGSQRVGEGRKNLFLGRKRGYRMQRRRVSTVRKYSRGGEFRPAVLAEERKGRGAGEGQVLAAGISWPPLRVAPGPCSAPKASCVSEYEARVYTHIYTYIPLSFWPQRSQRKPPFRSGYLSLLSVCAADEEGRG